MLSAVAIRDLHCPGQRYGGVDGHSVCSSRRWKKLPAVLLNLGKDTVG